MSNETTPRLIECPIKSFESDGSEGVSVTLKIPEHVADAVVRVSTSRAPRLCILVEAVPPTQCAGDRGMPEEIADRLVIPFGKGGVYLLRGDGSGLCNVLHDNLSCKSREVGGVTAVRAWLAGLIREGFAAGVASVGLEPSAQAIKDGAAHLDAAVREGLIDSWSHLGTREAFVSFHDNGASVPIPLHVASAVASIIRKAKQQVRDAVAQTKADGAAALVETYGPDALAKAREEGRADAFRKVAEWCQTSVPDTIDIDASIVEEVAKDVISHLQQAASDGEVKAREEGRRQGWKEVIARFDDKAIEHADTCDKKLWEANSMRVQAARLSEEARVQQETAKMAHAVADELRAAAPKEPA